MSLFAIIFRAEVSEDSFLEVESVQRHKIQVNHFVFIKRRPHRGLGWIWGWGYPRERGFRLGSCAGRALGTGALRLAFPFSFSPRFPCQLLTAGWWQWSPCCAQRDPGELQEACSPLWGHAGRELVNVESVEALGTPFQDVARFLTDLDLGQFQAVHFWF